MLVAVAGILKGSAFRVVTAVGLSGALADLDGIQCAVGLVAGMVGAGLNAASNFVVDMIHRKSLLIHCGDFRLH